MLVVVGCALLLCAIGWKLVVLLSRRSGLEHRISVSGVEARAIVLDYFPLDRPAGTNPRAALVLQVQPDGNRNFVTELISDYDPGEICRGQAIRVKYNPGNTAEMLVLVWHGGYERISVGLDMKSSHDSLDRPGNR